MSYVVAAPEMLAAASADLEGIRSVLSAANAAASSSGVLPAGAHEGLGGVGVAVSGHAGVHHALSAQAARTPDSPNGADALSGFFH
jgi:hypothetical protein